MHRLAKSFEGLNNSLVQSLVEIFSCTNTFKLLDFSLSLTEWKRLRISKCLHVNCDRNLVVVNYVLEKDLLEEADVASYTKIFSNHLCKQRQLLISSLPFSKHFSS